MSYLDLGYNVLLSKTTDTDITQGITDANVDAIVTAGAIGYDQTTVNTFLENQDMASKSFVSGSTGWQIKGDGVCEFNSITIRGTIYATAGEIGGWTIASNRLSGGSGATYIGLIPGTGIQVGDETFGSAPFSVTTAGVLSATSGVIGGFTLGSTEMYGGIIKTAETVEAGSNGVIIDTDGLRGYDAILGNTFDLPTDGSAPTFSSGVINETIFEISTNSVLRTSSTVGDGTANSAGVLINDTGIYGCEANQDLVDANFKILTTGGGSITFGTEGFLRGGQTDYATGDGFFLGYSSDDYKLSIGTSTNYLRWDGTYLTLKGSFDVGDNGVINNSVYTVANLPIAPTSVGFNSPSAYE